MRNPAFQSFVATVGADGTIILPLVDASNSGIPVMRMGPGYKRNGVRYFVRMPDIEESERYLPAPVGFNRKSITFEPVALVLSMPVPAHHAVTFFRIGAGKERGKISKRPCHTWAPLHDTALYPGLQIQMGQISPGETLDIQGTSFWTNDKKYAARKIKSPMHIPYAPEPPPQVTTLAPLSIQLLVKCHWLPNEIRKKTFQYVSGSPLGHNSEAKAPAPEKEYQWEPPEDQR